MQSASGDRPTIHVVDAFTDRPFAGNPAAVCVRDGPADDAWLRALGAEMNLSETAVVWPEAGAWRLRWFTPRAEVDLCGHATLAAAHILWQEGAAPSDSPIGFLTHSGLLEARQIDDRVELNFPAQPAVHSVADEEPGRVAEALRLASPPEAVARSAMDLLVELADEAAVRALDPDLERVAALGARGVIVTSLAGPATSEALGVDFVSRFFAPSLGVPEDPVTGSAHCTLGPWWAGRLAKDRLRGAQVSARGGIVNVILDGTRVRLVGSAVTILNGVLEDADNRGASSPG